MCVAPNSRLALAHKYSRNSSVVGPLNKTRLHYFLQKIEKYENDLAEEVKGKSELLSEIEKLKREKDEVDSTLGDANKGIELSKQVCHSPSPVLFRDIAAAGGKSSPDKFVIL